MKDYQELLNELSKTDVGFGLTLGEVKSKELKALQKLINKVTKSKSKLKLDEDTVVESDVVSIYGCPTEVINQAFLKGVCLIDSLNSKRTGQVYYLCRLENEYKLLVQTSSGGKFIKLSDYQKTWWIRGEEN